MTTASSSLTPINSSDATFRAWGSGIKALLAAVGLVQTSDTGQVDWATVLYPSIANTVRGYEIWRFDDALQGSYPLYVKIEYGSAVNFNNPSLYVTVGKGSDGAGTISSIIIPRTRTYDNAGATSGSSTVASTSYASSGPDEAMCAVVPFVGGDAWACPAFIIERSRDSTGDPTGAGVMFACANGTGSAISSGTSGQPAIMICGNYATMQTCVGRVPVTIPKTIAGSPLGAASSLALTALAPVFPWTCYAPGCMPWQAMAGISWVDDPGGLFTARILGADRTYRSIPLNSSHNSWGCGQDTNISSMSYYVGLAILWG